MKQKRYQHEPKSALRSLPWGTLFARLALTAAIVYSTVSFVNEIRRQDEARWGIIDAAITTQRGYHP